MGVDSRRLRLAWYGFTVFLGSAILLVLEITAGRLIAPYVGVTLYSWTSIIGVVLAGLSLGNWIGGCWADRIPPAPGRMTYVIAASDAGFPGDVLEAGGGLRRAWLNIDEPLFRTGTPLAELPVFRDDFVPVERMIAGLLLRYEGR